LMRQVSNSWFFELFVHPASNSYFLCSFGRRRHEIRNITNILVIYW
jgi:hypothetical protein